MNDTRPLQQGQFYHIYNRGINGCDLFKENDNYKHFLGLYNKYIDPIAYTFAWCLMKNHFHLLIRVKDEDEIDPIDKTFQSLPDLEGLARRPGRSNPRIPIPSTQFSHLFNAYAKAFNKRYNRTGSLFEKNFHRIFVKDKFYFKYLIYYIHNNPVHHGITNTIIEYPWTSYLDIITISGGKGNNEKVIGWFNDVGNFISFHQSEPELDIIEDLKID